LVHNEKQRKGKLGNYLKKLVPQASASKNRFKPAGGIAMEEKTSLLLAPYFAK
jgi:hypothetical protein